MDRYIYPDEARAFLEGLQQPFAVYQTIDGKIHTILVSEGFCRLFGHADRAQAAQSMERDMYKNIHADDVQRLTEATARFAANGGDYDAVFRTRSGVDTDYRVIHARGRHVMTDTGARLGQVWYMDEGLYIEGDEASGSPMNRELNSVLHEESILRAANYDTLTGLPNLAHFFKLCEIGKARVLGEGKQGCLLYIDLYGMKYYNHHNGFAAGDALLKAYAELLARNFGPEDCCRIGGDRFAVSTTQDGLEDRLRGFFGAVEQMKDHLPVRVGIYSTGIEDVPISMAYDRAKMACDAIHTTDASSFRWYTLELSDITRRRNYIQGNIDRAIENKWIVVYYQSIVRAVSEKVCDVEALARWIDPELGFLSPAEFIPELEASGQIYKLDLYVLEQVLEKIKREQAAGKSVVPHSINLSRSDFESHDIVEEIRARVDAAGVRRDLITIEITESVIGRNLDYMKKQVQRFRQLGFPVWMDDFGSGYSSLDVLQSIQFDLIKFDMSFMRKLNEGGRTRVVLTDLMKLAISLGVDTVCEGVETAEQVHFLQEISCSKLQGYYYCKPAPAEAVTQGAGGVPFDSENREETAYYEAIGRVDLYDLTVMTSEDAAFQNAFNTMPMGILEIEGSRTRYLRSSQSYRDFMMRFFGYDVNQEPVDLDNAPEGFTPEFIETVRQCCEEGGRAFIDETMPDGSRVHTFLKRIGVNPITGTTAIAVAVLSVGEPSESVVIEKLLSVMAQFGEHIPGGLFICKADGSGELLCANRAVCEIFGCDGLEDFKAYTGFSVRGMIHPEDREKIAAMARKMDARSMDQGSLEYRILRKDGEVRWVDDRSHYMEADIYHGLYFVFITDITSKYLQAQSDKALRSAVIEALTKPYDSVWLVTDIENEQFELFRIDPEMAHLMPANAAVKIKKFSDAFAFYSRLVLEADRQRFLQEVTAANIVKNTRDRLIYSVPFRRIFEDGIHNYRVEFTRFDLPGGKMGIVGGFRNVDEEVRRNRETQRALTLRAAVIEALTSAYDSVWLIRDLETQRFEHFRTDENLVHLLPSREAEKTARFHDAFVFYSKLVLEADRQRFLEAVTPESIAANTQEKHVYAVPFRRVFEDGIRNYRVEFIRIDQDNGKINIVTGFRDMDSDG